MALQAKCDETSSNDDLHLVVPDAGEHRGKARVLAAAPRFVRRRETALSIPLAVVTVPLLERLRRLGKVAAGDECIGRLEFIARERQRGRWAARAQRAVQQPLALDEHPGGASTPSLL